MPKFVKKHPWLSLFFGATAALCIYGELWARSEKSKRLGA